MGRSYAEPTLGRSAGARLTVTRLPGREYPEEARAARTRSRASRIAVSGKPTTVSAGFDGLMWTSTLTDCGSMPTRATEVTDANIRAT